MRQMNVGIIVGRHGKDVVSYRTLQFHALGRLVCFLTSAVLSKRLDPRIGSTREYRKQYLDT